MIAPILTSLGIVSLVVAVARYDRGRPSGVPLAAGVSLILAGLLCHCLAPPDRGRVPATMDLRVEAEGSHEGLCIVLRVRTDDPDAFLAAFHEYGRLEARDYLRYMADAYLRCEMCRSDALLIDMAIDEQMFLNRLFGDLGDVYDASVGLLCPYDPGCYTDEPGLREVERHVDALNQIGRAHV